MQLDTSLGFQLNRAARLMGQRLSDELRSLGLTTSQWAALQFASQHPGCHQERLVRELDTDAATLTEVLRRLESRGLIERAPDPADRRRRLVRVRPAARAAEGAVLAQAVNERATRGFTAEELGRLLDYLDRIRDNLAETAPEDRP